MDPTKSLRKLLDACEAGPLMVHSDVLRASRFVPEYRGKRQSLEDHYQILRTVAGERPIWMPTFNYEFTSRGEFDVTNSQSQVGALTRHFRKEHANWRTAVPVFSFAGTGQCPSLGRETPVQPFGPNSVFATLLKRNGTILFYGAPFTSVTFVHHTEHICQPVYRYDKCFRGNVIQDGISKDVTVEFHVRPLGVSVEYDFNRMLQDLYDIGIAKYLNGDDPAVIVANAREVNEFWQRRIRQDPFYLLKTSCRSALEQKYAELGRRFQVSDFETNSKPWPVRADSRTA